MNRVDFQQLAEERIIDAECLLNLQRWSASYYLAGYAIECALKACIASLTSEHDFPPKVRIVQECYSHDIVQLLKTAGLKLTLDNDTTANSALSSNWGIVKDWNEQSRYQQTTPVKAQTLYDAITNNPDGVLPWIRKHW